MWISVEIGHGCCSMKLGTIFITDFGVLKTKFLVHSQSPNSLPSFTSHSLTVSQVLTQGGSVLLFGNFLSLSIKKYNRKTYMLEKKEI